MKYLYHVGIAPGIHYDCIAEAGLKIKCRDDVIVRCDRYQDYGVVLRCFDQAPIDEGKLKASREKSRGGGRRVEGQRTPLIIRHATLVDRSKAHENEVRTRSMRRTAQDKIHEHGLDMRLVNTHQSFDKKVVVFQFTADGRVDFRDLVRDLSKVLHTRVELRQIGVRDEAAIQGGIGCCGRPFCCATFLREFVSINVRMAKDQGLSLNPNNISGACGRLKCCLKFEADGYRAMRKGVLKNGAACTTPEGPGRVLDSNLLTGQMRVRLAPPSDKVALFASGEVEPRSRDRSQEPVDGDRAGESGGGRRGGGSRSGGGRRSRGGSGRGGGSGPRRRSSSGGGPEGESSSRPAERD